MKRSAMLKQWLIEPPVAGWAAFNCSLVAVATPTAIRASVDGLVTGVVLTPYFPFVLLSAIMLGWRHAVLVSLVSAVIADIWFIGPPNQFMEGPTDVFAVGVFLFASGAVIGFVQSVRHLIGDTLREMDREQPDGGIVFSLEAGEAWASWYGNGGPVRLGPRDEVAETMEDFLAQVELGKRLTGEIRE